MDKNTDRSTKNGNSLSIMTSMPETTRNGKIFNLQSMKVTLQRDEINELETDQNAGFKLRNKAMKEANLEEQRRQSLAMFGFQSGNEDCKKRNVVYQSQEKEQMYKNFKKARQQVKSMQADIRVYKKRDFQEYKPAEISSSSFCQQNFSEISTTNVNIGSVNEGSNPDYSRIVHKNYKMTRSPVYTSYQTNRNKKSISVAQQLLTHVNSQAKPLTVEHCPIIRRPSTQQAHIFSAPPLSPSIRGSEAKLVSEVNKTFESAMKNKVYSVSPFVGERIKKEIIQKELFDQDPAANQWIYQVNHNSLREFFQGQVEKNEVGTRIIHSQFKKNVSESTSDQLRTGSEISSMKTGNFLNSQASDLLETLKTRQDAKTKQLQWRILQQKQERIQAAQKARDDARKAYLLNKDPREIVKMLDKIIEIKNTYLTDIMKKDIQQTDLKEYVQNQQDYISQGLFYIKNQYSKSIRKQMNDPNFNNCCVKYCINRSGAQNKFTDCNHSQVKEEQLLYFYREFRTIYIFENQAKRQEPKKITREQCVKNAIKKNPQIVKFANMYRKIRSVDGMAESENGVPRQWVSKEPYDKQILSPRELIYTKYAQNTNMNYVYESPFQEQIDLSIKPQKSFQLEKSEVKKTNKWFQNLIDYEPPKPEIEDSQKQSDFNQFQGSIMDAYDKFIDMNREDEPSSPHPVSKLRLFKKAVKNQIQDNKQSFKIGSSISQQFYEFIKENFNHGISDETNYLNKMFYDFFIESYNYGTPIPAFRFIQDQTLYVNNYKLSLGQINGLQKILIEYPYSLDITKVDLCNCVLGDKGFSQILDGLSNLEVITSLTYQQDEMLERSTKKIIEFLKRRKRRTVTKQNSVMSAESQTQNLFYNKGELQKINLISVRTNNSCLISLFQQVSYCQKISSLRLSDVNLSNNQVFDELLNIIRELSALQTLDLSDCNIKTKQLIQIAQLLDESQNQCLLSLNLSYNVLMKDAEVFAQSMGNYVKYSNALIHLNLQGMQLKESVLILAKSIMKQASGTLVSVHLSDNQVPNYAQNSLMEIFKVQKGDQQNHQLKTDKFKKIKQFLLQQDFNHIIEKDEEKRKCMIINIQHLKHVNKQKHRIADLAREFHRGLEDQRSLINEVQPLIFTRVTTNEELQMHDAIQFDMGDFPPVSNWKQPVNHNCYVCERQSNIWIFYRPELAFKEFTRIKDQAVVDSLIQMYKLDVSKFNVPIIFGSLLDQWKTTRPMVYASHYSLNFLSQIKNKDQEFFRKQLLALAKQSCIERVDPIESHQVGGSERSYNLFDPMKILDIQCNLRGQNKQAKLVDALLHMKQKYDNMQIFNHPSNANGNADIPEEELNFIPNSPGCLQENFMFSTMATPGIHMILIYDPKSKQMFKKLITVNPKDVNKEIIPNKLETQVSDEEHYQIQMFKKDYKQEFEQDIKREKFKPKKFCKEPDSLLLEISKHYQSICQLYRHLILEQMLSKIVLGDSPKECLQNLETAEKYMSKGFKCKNVKTFRDAYLPSIEDLSDLEILLISSSDKEKLKFHSRSELLELFLRIALKYPLEPIFTHLSSLDESLELQNNLWINSALHINQDILFQVYEYYHTADDLIRKFTIKSAWKMLNHLVSFEILSTNFYMSNDGLELNFQQFLEFVGRIVNQQQKIDLSDKAMKKTFAIKSQRKIENYIMSSEQEKVLLVLEAVIGKPVLGNEIDFTKMYNLI